MRISFRLTVTLVVAAVVPLLAAGFLWADMGRREIDRGVRLRQEAVARRAAEAADRWLLESTQSLRLAADLFEYGRLEGDALLGALRLTYWHVEQAAIVGLYDDGGAAVGGPVYRREVEPGELRLPANDADVEIFNSRAPIRAALESSDGLAIGSPYLCARRHSVMVPVAVRVPDKSGTDWALASELALSPLQLMVGRLSDEASGVVYLVDPGGLILAHPNGRLVMTPVTDGLLNGLEEQRSGEAGVLRDREGRKLFAASAPMEWPRWLAVVEQTREQAFAAFRSVGVRTSLVVGLALAFAVGSGAFLSRGIAVPIKAAAGRALAIATGGFSGRLKEEGPLELREMARSFNEMVDELVRSKGEVDALNRDLERRVAEQTADLKRAQAELLQSRKLAAVGDLGAGVAHEINNPLTGILGASQLLLRRKDPEDGDLMLLRRIEEDAKRCREITMNLLRFSEQERLGALCEADLDAIASSALGLRASMLQGKGIEVSRSSSHSPIPVKADLGQIQQVVLNLLSNAGHATPAGGRISVETGVEDQFGYVRVSDTGRGIPPENLDRIMEPFFTTKDHWRGAGLGLSVAYSIVESHSGAIEVTSEVGVGTQFTVRLPLLEVAA